MDLPGTTDALHTLRQRLHAHEANDDTPAGDSEAVESVPQAVVKFEASGAYIGLPAELCSPAFEKSHARHQRPLIVPVAAVTGQGAHTLVGYLHRLRATAHISSRERER